MHLVSEVLDDFVQVHAEDVLRRRGDTYVAVPAAVELVREAQRRGVRVLGLEGFLVSDDAVYPALSRIADFSDETAAHAAERAQELLSGAWITPPTSDDQMQGARTDGTWSS